MKNEAQRTPLAPRDIYNSNITSSSIEVSPFAKISSTMRKRRATVIPAVPKHFQDFDSLPKNSDPGRTRTMCSIALMPLQMMKLP